VTNASIAIPCSERYRYGLSALCVVDDVLADPVGYTAAARRATFASVTGAAGEAFHGIAPCTDGELARWITTRFPDAHPTLTFFRQSPGGQIEPNYVHSDFAMGDWTGILYLTEQPIAGDGTVFWRDVETGATGCRSAALLDYAEEYARWRDGDRWTEWARVAAQPNRLVLFPSALYHSRALRDNYGDGATARLIQVMFGTGTLKRG